MIRGLDAARRWPQARPLNAVVIRGQNDRDLPSLVRIAAARCRDAFHRVDAYGPLAESWEQRFVPERTMATIDPIVTS